MYISSAPMANVYFELTQEFNADGVIALLASGQAVVFYPAHEQGRRLGSSRDRERLPARVDGARGRGARYRPYPRSTLAGSPVAGRATSSSPMQPLVASAATSSAVRRASPRQSSTPCSPPRAARARSGSRSGAPHPPEADAARQGLPRDRRDLAAAPAAERGRARPRTRTGSWSWPVALEAARRGERAHGAPGGTRDEVVVALAREVDRLQPDDCLRLRALRAGRARLPGGLSFRGAARGDSWTRRTRSQSAWPSGCCR